MIKAVLLTTLLFTAANLFAVETKDFGEVGELVEIAEVNGEDLINSSLKNFNPEEIVTKLKLDIEKAFTSNVSIKDNLSNQTIIKEDLVRARWDVISPNGVLLYKKGDFIPSFLPTGITLELCFINTNERRVVLDEIVKTFGKCTYIVNKGDSRKFAKRYSKVSYPLVDINMEYLTRFKVTSFPTKITKKKNLIITKNINIIDLRKLLEEVK